MYICHINFKKMYQLTDANLNQISAWFNQDLPCKNGISIIDMIKIFSTDNTTEVATADVAVAETAE